MCVYTHRICEKVAILRTAVSHCAIRHSVSAGEDTMMGNVNGCKQTVQLMRFPLLLNDSVQNSRYKKVVWLLCCRKRIICVTGNVISSQRTSFHYALRVFTHPTPAWLNRIIDWWFGATGICCSQVWDEEHQVLHHALITQYGTNRQSKMYALLLWACARFLCINSSWVISCLPRNRDSR